MSLNWFPGHMNKARRELGERVQKSDLVIELLDARAPRASMNPMLKQLAGSLPRLRLLTKADLADPRVTSLWAAELGSSESLTKQSVTGDHGLKKRVAAAGRRLCPKRGRPGFPVRAMIVGIPNVGKSTLFNALVGKRKANVEDRPAVTRREQHAEVTRDLVIVDTPGVLWPKLEDQRAAHCLAALGSVGEAAFDVVAMAFFVLGELVQRYPGMVGSRFSLGEEAAEPSSLLDHIGRKRGCLLRGGEVDLVKTAQVVLGELRSGQLGRISLEWPDDRAHRSEP